MNTTSTNSPPKIKHYARDKAEKTFDTLPYTVTDDKAYRQFLSRKGAEKRTIHTIAGIAMRTAAVLFIPLAIYTLYRTLHDTPVPEATFLTIGIPEQNPAYIEYIINPGVKGKILLPDSTEVWINSCSILKSPSRFDSTGRCLELSGEAYFKVKSYKNWPMYIKTPQGVTARVLGTEFNISAYNNDPTVKLTLVNGKVELINNNNNKITLEPHEQVTVFNDTNKNDRKKAVTNIENDIAWKEGYLIFNNTPMPDVIKKIERWYGVRFNPVEADIARYNFTARFKSESITQILDLLSISSNIKYKISGNTVTLYKKEEAI